MATRSAAPPGPGAVVARLVHVTTVPQSLGFLAGQVTFMRERGFEITALSSPGPELGDFGEREGVATHAVDMPRRITPLRDIGAVWRIYRHLRRIRPQLVHSHTPKGGLLGTTSAWLARVPVRVYHIRGLPFMTATGRRRTLLRWTERLSCTLATRVLCVSRSVADVATAEGICPPGKIDVLLSGSGNGVDAAGRFDPAAQRAAGQVAARPGAVLRGDGPRHAAELPRGTPERAARGCRDGAPRRRHARPRLHRRRGRRRDGNARPLR
jgi:hypothetical protein